MKGKMVGIEVETRCVLLLPLKQSLGTNKVAYLKLDDDHFSHSLR